MVDRAHAVVVEQLGEQSRHRDAVLQHVGDARRHADVVLEDLPGPVAVADEVAAGDVRVDAARRADAVHGAREVRARHDELPGHEARTHDLPRVVGVVDERVQRPDALCEAALDDPPVRGRDDPRPEVHRQRPVARAVLTGQLERDALAQEDRVASPPRLRQAVRAETGERCDELRRVRRHRAVRGEDLVEEALARGVAGAVGDRGLGGHRRPSFQRRRRACITGRADSARRCVETQLPRGPNRTISASSTRSEPSGSEVTQTR